MLTLAPSFGHSTGVGVVEAPLEETVEEFDTTVSEDCDWLQWELEEEECGSTVSSPDRDDVDGGGLAEARLFLLTVRMLPRLRLRSIWMTSTAAGRIALGMILDR